MCPCVGHLHQRGGPEISAPATLDVQAFLAAAAIDRAPEQGAVAAHDPGLAGVGLDGQYFAKRLWPESVPGLVLEAPLRRGVAPVARAAHPEPAVDISAPEPRALHVVVRRDLRHGHPLVALRGPVHPLPAAVLAHGARGPPENAPLPVDAPHGVVVCVQLRHVPAFHHVPPSMVVVRLPAPLGKQEVLFPHAAHGAVFSFADHPNRPR
mmetsp:Transcript_137013/g.341584  ORF Transcript_137013/g.341584 Transcript_137013/m.341584 type:complete len:209 (-) Transcript_137013:163-789(-)